MGFILLAIHSYIIKFMCNTSLSRLKIIQIYKMHLNLFYICTAWYPCVQLISYGSYTGLYYSCSIRPGKVDLKFMSELFLKGMQAGDHFSIFLTSYDPVQVVTETIKLSCQPNTEHTLAAFSYFSTTEIAIILSCLITSCALNIRQTTTKFNTFLISPLKNTAKQLLAWVLHADITHQQFYQTAIQEYLSEPDA